MTLTACGGSGGGSGTGASAGPPPANLGQATDELNAFGITGFSVVPNPRHFVFNWINPSAPNATISSYTVKATVYTSATGSSRIDDELSRNIDYAGNNTRQDYTYSVISDYHYEFFAMANYADGNSSEQIRLFTGRLFAGLNTDGDDLADEQDPDDDNDGVNDSTDNCPLIPNPVQSNLGDIGDKEFGDVCDVFNDYDGDGEVDQDDLDADGDGLIEIYNAVALNAMRNNLLGTGLDIDNNDNVSTTGGDTTGCDNRNLATDCAGYELANDINLADYGAWQPIGSCNDIEQCSGAASSFNTIFEGNDRQISNMFINISGNQSTQGDGLFGAIGAQSELRNIHLTQANISIDPQNILGSIGAVGGLAGYALGAIINSSVELIADLGTSMSIGDSVGGLVGVLSHNTQVVSSHVIATNIVGFKNIGGLIGFQTRSTSVEAVSSASIINSYVIAKSIAGGNVVGGLVGMNSQDIYSSVALVETISVGPSGEVGGIAGRFEGKMINSAVIVKEVKTPGFATGGVIGASITNSDEVLVSLAAVHTIAGTHNGGLVGIGRARGTSAGVDISYSLALTSVIDGSRDVGGLVGQSGMSSSSADLNPGTIKASYWDDSVMFADANPETTNTAGTGQSTSALQSETDFEGIYADWGGATAGWCHPTTGVYSNATARPEGYMPVWNLNDESNDATATPDDYPVPNCLPFTPKQLRAAIKLVRAGESPLPAVLPAAN